MWGGGGGGRWGGGRGGGGRGEREGLCECVLRGSEVGMGVRWGGGSR